MNQKSNWWSAVVDRIRQIPLNLRGKLIFANGLITFIAILSMGLYIYFRTQQTNSYLTTQLTQSVHISARDKLLSTSNEQAGILNNFFTTISKDITSIGKTVENLIAKESVLSSGSYWDAATSLSRLPTGSWDNSDEEIASVFIPAAVELDPPLISELNTIKHTESYISPLLAANPDIIAIYFGGLSKETLYFPNIDLAAIVPPDFDVTGRPWFVAASPAQNPDGEVVWSVPYEDAALHGLVVTASIPVYNDRGVFLGVSAMDIQLNRISDIIANIHVGETGYAFLIDRDQRLIAFPPSAYEDFSFTAETVPLGQVVDPALSPKIAPDFFSMLKNVAAGDNSLTTISLNGVDRFIVYQPIPEVDYGLVIITPTEELLSDATIAQLEISRTTRNTIAVSALLVAAILLAAALATVGFGNLLTSPLKNLTNTAQQITGGNLDAKAEIQSEDEIGLLGKTLNSMTATLRGFIQSLEQRVAERTTELQNALQKEGRRSRQFEAITKVTQAASAEQSTAVLLPEVCRVISDQFGFYHVGIFLNDSINQYAILTASNSEGGSRMMERHHQLKIGEQGIVGYVTATGNPRIALDVGRDAIFFDNPDLPETRSEMALPLRIGDNIIGSLDVQSTEPNAFSHEDVEVLSTLAVQVSLAIQNARLFEQTRRSLTEAESLYRQYLREAWGRLPEDEKLTGYRYKVSGVEPLDGSLEPENGGRGVQPKDLESDANPRVFVEVPIELRGERLGTLKVEAPANKGKINSDQMDMIRAVAERVALSAENARLFDEISRRAQRERMVSDITTKIRSTNDPQQMVRTAIEELRQALGASRVEVIPQKSGTGLDSNGS